MLVSAWDATGPILIGIITMLVVALLCWVIVGAVPNGLKELMKKLSPYLIMAAAGYSIYVAAGLWAWR
ncbi:hypothetical protein [Paenibacillus sp. NRS-1760]|uniref:hypothetical protein n=1 Tax=Paenibacillus sp. NRS-1760 TaxID=3233902 RepID=UPI003D2A9849